MRSAGQPAGERCFWGLRFQETGLESPICSAGNPGALCRIPVSKHDGLLMQPPSAQGRAERAEERELVISQGFPMVVMAGQQTSPSAGSLTRFFRGRYIIGSLWLSSGANLCRLPPGWKSSHPK